MDERYLLATVRYVEFNPVKEKLCVKPEHWCWSSVITHLSGQDDQVVTVKPLLKRIADWNDDLSTASSTDGLDSIRRFTSSGRPAGDETFIHNLEQLTGRELYRKKPGPKPAIK